MTIFQPSLPPLQMHVHPPVLLVNGGWHDLSVP